MKKSIYTAIDAENSANGMFIINDEAGNAVRVFEDKPLEGSIQLMERKLELIPLLNSCRVQMKKKFAWLNGDVASLKMMLSMWEANGEIPGRVATREYLDDENLPKAIRDSKGFDFLIKRTSKDGLILTVDDVQIISTRVYDPFSNLEDILIQHTNKEEVLSFRALEKANEDKPETEDAEPEMAMANLDGKKGK